MRRLLKNYKYYQVKDEVESSILSGSTIAASGTMYLVLTTPKARRIGFANTDETSCKDPLA